MNRVLLIIGGLLVGLLAALFVVPVFVDWTRYRGTFEEEATRMLGRDVRVGGKVNLRLLPTPYVRFEKVRITDTKATVGEPLFKADDFTIWLAVSPLLRGDFEASVIELHKPVLALVLDDQGGGNWTNLAETAEKTNYAPNKIAFDNVRINNGTIAVFGPAGDEKTRIEHINGEFSSPAIEGPYKIAAAFAHGGMPRELRLSTAKPEPDGAIRLKGVVRAPVAGISYSIDGRLMDLFRQPRLQGELSAKLPLPNASAGSGPNASAGSEKQPAARGQAGESYDLKSTIKADVSGAEFGDITLAFDQDGQPQLATGTARLVWRDRATAAIKLHSRWLDIDRMSGRENKTPLPQQLASLAKSLDAALPAEIQTTLSIDLDQATLGGDIVSGIAITAERKEQVLGIRASAGLPGGSRIEANGSIAGGGHAFDGDVNLRGTSAARFLAWASRNTSQPPVTRDGPFAISGRAFLGAESIAGRNLAIQFAGNNVTGEASWSNGPGGRQIVLALDGEELDLTPFTGEQATPLAAMKILIAKLGDLASVSGATAPAASTPETMPAISARLRTTQLTAGRANLQDVTVNLRYAGGDLSIPQLRFGSNVGWSVELQGDIAGLARPGSKGGITWAATAETAQGLQDLIAAGELGTAWQLSSKRATALLPLHLAGQLRIGEAAAAYDASFDGNLGPTRASGTFRIDPKGESWRDHRADIAITLDGSDAGRMMEQFAPDTWSLATAVAARQPGRILLRGIGTPKAGLVSLASVETTGLAAEYRGRLLATETARLGVEGELRMATTDVAQMLALAGIRERTSLAGQPVSGVVAISGSQDHLRLTSGRFDMGSVAVSGDLDLETRPAGPRLSGRLITSRMNIPVWVGFLTPSRSQIRLGPPPPPAMGPPPPPQLAAWSEDAFDLAALANFDSKIRIETASLDLSPEITLGKATVDLETIAGRLDLKLSEASSLGGKLTGTLQIDRAAAGAVAKITVGLKDARLEASAAAGAKPAASGALSLQLGLEGTGSNPRNLIAALQGKGEIVIGQGRIDRLAPRGLGETVEAMLAIKGEPPQGELARRLMAAFSGGTIPFGRRTVMLQVTDGVVRLAPLAFDTPEGRLTGTTTIDLDSLRFDSEWRIDPKPQSKSELAKSEPAKSEAKSELGPNGKQRAPLPGVVAVYAAPLDRLGTVEPRLQFEDLEREIAVRKVERDLEELERLRKLDEERSRIEAERRQKLEAEKAAAASAPPGSTPGILVPAIQVPAFRVPLITGPPGQGPVPEPGAAAPASKAPMPAPAPAPPTPAPAATNPAPPQPKPPAASAAPPMLIEVPAPAPAPPPQPAAPPPSTTTGAVSPAGQLTPPVAEDLTVPSASDSNAPHAAVPAPQASEGRPAGQPRPEPQPKSLRRDVFGDQTRAAP